MKVKAYSFLINQEEAAKQVRPGFFARKAEVQWEKIHLPCHFVLIERPTSNKEPVCLHVDGYSQKVFHLDLVEIEKEAIESEFPYPLSEQETLKVVREALLEWRLNRLVKRDVSERDLKISGTVYHPYWVRYELRGQKRVTQFKMVDGVTGRVASQDIRLGFLEALRVQASSAS